MHIRRMIAAGAAALVSASAALAGGTHGATIITEGNQSSGGPWTLGWEFTALSDITVTHLGYYDNGMDGLGSSHEVGLWDASGNLLPSTIVNPGDALEGFFRWHSISAVALNGGENYVVGGINTGDNYAWDGQTSYGPEISFVGDRWISGGTLAFPTNTSGVTTPFFGGNFKYGAIPAPGALAILGLGGLTANRRRRC